MVKNLPIYAEQHRFLPAIASEMGVSIVETVVIHRPRRHGRSKYGLSRSVRVILDLLTVKFLLSYSTRPLQIFGLVGGVMGTVGAVMLGVLGYQKIFLHAELSNRDREDARQRFMDGRARVIVATKAFGMGVDRITGLRYRVPDIRLLLEGDLRLLEAF